MLINCHISTETKNDSSLKPVALVLLIDSIIASSSTLDHVSISWMIFVTNSRDYAAHILTFKHTD